MKIPFGYYKGCTIKEWWNYAIKSKAKRIFYGILYKVWHPEIINAKTPCIYLFTIVDENGYDITQRNPPIVEYNSKTHKGYILQTESDNPKVISFKKDANGEPLKKEIDMPGTKLFFKG